MTKQLERLKPTGILAPDGREFPWGPITRIHHIGRYDIVEFLRDNSKLHTSDVERARAEHGTPHFHPYVELRSLSRSYGSLEHALIGALAVDLDGFGSRVDNYIARMLGIGDEA